MAQIWQIAAHIRKTIGDPEMYETGEPLVDEATIQKAIDFISQAYDPREQHLPYFDVNPFWGEIDITWKSPDLERMFRLVIYPGAKPPVFYINMGDGGKTSEAYPKNMERLLASVTMGR